VILKLFALDVVRTSSENEWRIPHRLALGKSGGGEERKGKKRKEKRIQTYHILYGVFMPDKI